MGFDEERGLCFAFAATRLIQIDPSYTKTSVGLCKVADSEGFGERCYYDLLFYSKYSFQPGSEAHRSYCEALPKPHRAKCLAGDVPDNFYFDPDESIGLF